MERVKEWQVAASYQCGCRIIEDSGPYIDYCPKHAAAPEMFEALKLVDSAFDVIDGIQQEEALAEVVAALVLAGDMYLGQVEANDLEWNDRGIIREE